LDTGAEEPPEIPPKQVGRGTSSRSLRGSRTQKFTQSGDVITVTIEPKSFAGAAWRTGVALIDSPPPCFRVFAFNCPNLATIYRSNKNKFFHYFCVLQGTVKRKVWKKKVEIFRTISQSLMF
jgi:hypothetical protein